MDLAGVPLSAVSQTGDDKYCMTSLTCGTKLNNRTTPAPPQKTKFIEKGLRFVVARKGGGSELEEGGQKVETSSYKTNTGAVMYNVTTA